MFDFGIILGMNWLHTYGTKIDCEDLKVVFNDGKEREVCFYGQRQEISYPLISAIKASKLLCQRCIRYRHAIDIETKEEKAKNIPVVCKFEDIFSEELPGLTLQRIIDFGIELILGAQPISKAPYRVALTGFKELKVQLDELLQKGFISLVCHHGEP